MTNGYMLTVVGRDQAGIVARIANAIFACGGNLGEASMTRLGENFTVMLMVSFAGPAETLHAAVQPAAEALGLKLHLDPIDAALHRHATPDARITVFGADRAGIVAQVTTALAEAGFNILDLQSDVAGTEAKPIYIMQIEGCATRGMEVLQAALEPLRKLGIEVHVVAVDTLVG